MELPVQTYRIFMRAKFFEEKIDGEIFLNVRTIDQIVLKWGRSFINDKYIF